MTEKDRATTKISPEGPDGPERQPDRAQPGPEGAPPRTRAGALWAGIVVSAVVLILLLVFIVQNGSPVQIYFLGWAATLPTGVALLAAAVAGILVVAIPGASRIVQLRRAARRRR